MKYPKILKDISKNVPLWPPSFAEGTCVSHTFFLHLQKIMPLVPLPLNLQFTLS